MKLDHPHSVSALVPLILALVGHSSSNTRRHSEISRYYEDGWWTKFKMDHILDPGISSNYFRWTQEDWISWFLRRRSSKSSSFHQLRHHRHYGSFEASSDEKNLVRSLRLLELVVVAKPGDVLKSFDGSLTKYGTRNQALFWSSRSFQAYVFRRAGDKLSVYNCGYLYLSARLCNACPVYLHDFYPFVLRNPLGGYLRYPVTRQCRLV